MKVITDVAKNWNAALTILYNREEYINEFISIISKYGINKKSNILDSSVGTGFLSLDLMKMGYRVVMNDSSGKMLRLLKSNARESNVKSLEIYNIPWQMLSTRLNHSYDSILCRGNSLVYVRSWHQRVQDFTEVKKDILLSLKNFYQLLNPNGLLWIDITSDKEILKGPEIIEKFNRIIGGGEIEMTWKIIHDRKRRLRTVKSNFLINNVHYNHTLYSYFMISDELIDLLNQIGFRKIKKVNMKNEIYTILVARK